MICDQTIDFDPVTDKGRSGEDPFLPEPSRGFVETPFIKDLTDRAISYLEVGYPVHLSGPSGTGKTTLAFHIASRLGRPCTLIHGDDQYRSQDLVGRDAGFRKSRIVDNYVRSIVKTEEQMNSVWIEHRLTKACQHGYTFIYDEFTRSRPETNNVLLSVLEERLLAVPAGDNIGYRPVHEQFRAIFTSNPEEYAGVHKTQDALLDRMITLQLNELDQETEVAVTAAKSGLTLEQARIIVGIVRDHRAAAGAKECSSVRSAIAIAKITKYRRANIDAHDTIFQVTCLDVLSSQQTNSRETSRVNATLQEIVRRHAVPAILRNLPRVSRPARSD